MQNYNGLKVIVDHNPCVRDLDMRGLMTKTTGH